MYLFISHSSVNANIATELCKVIEQNGHKCFLAPRDIRTGHVYAEEIIDGLDRSEAMLLLLSKASNESPHVLREIERAVSRNIPIIVYKIEEVELAKSMEYFLMTHQWLNAKLGDYAQVIKSIDGLNEKAKTTEESDRNKNAVVAGADKNIINNNINEISKNNSKNKAALFIGIGAVASVVIIIILIMILTGASGDEDRKPVNTTETGEAGNDNLVSEKDTTPEDTSEKETTGKEPETTDAGNGTVDREAKLGDTIVFGQYNGEDIYWRVIKISDDGTEAVLLARDIITMKAFDAAESGEYAYVNGKYYPSNDEEVLADNNLQIKARGNSDWESSNIRTWLNSEKEVVLYSDQAPMGSAMSEKVNGYDNEPGFLNGFTDEEIDAIKVTDVETEGNALRAGETVTTKDRVFLLSLDELAWLVMADVSQLAVPTEGALEQDNSQWYEIEVDSYSIDEYCWWLRDPVAGSASMCYMVGHGYYEDNIWENNVGLEGFGVRPAITIDLASDAYQIVE